MGRALGRRLVLVGCLAAVACGTSAPGAGPGTTPVPTAATPVAGGSTRSPAPGSTVGPGPTGPAGTVAAGPAAGRVTYHHDAGRSGVDPSSPPATDVARAWTSPELDGAEYAQPLVVGDEVVVATENDTVYALDRTTGSPRWTRHLGSSVAGSSLPCGNIDPSGITGTPVADPATATVWVVAFEQPAHHVLVALDLADGSVRSERPADAAGSDPTVEQQRGALSLANGTVYIPYGGLYGDCGDYLGRLVGLPASGTGDGVAFAVPNRSQAGIWAPAGAAVAGDGSLYVATGNGTSTDAFADADAVVRFSAGLDQLDAFAPREWAAMNDADQDLGTVSPTLVPGGLVLQVGKQGIGYLLDAGDLGGVGGERFQAQVCGSAYGATAIDGSTVFVPCRDGLFALSVSAGSSPRFVPAWSAPGRARAHRSWPVAWCGTWAPTAICGGSTRRPAGPAPM